MKINNQYSNDSETSLRVQIIFQIGRRVLNKTFKKLDDDNKFTMRNASSTFVSLDAWVWDTLLRGLGQ